MWKLKNLGPIFKPPTPTYLPATSPTRGPHRHCDRNTEWRCGSGECVPLYSRCDLNRNCRDGSDERNCRKFMLLFNFCFPFQILSLTKTLQNPFKWTWNFSFFIIFVVFFKFWKKMGVDVLGICSIVKMVLA